MPGENAIGAPLPGLTPFTVNGVTLYLRKLTGADLRQWQGYYRDHPAAPWGECFAWLVSRAVVDERGGRLFATADEVAAALTLPVVQAIAARVRELMVTGA